MTRRRTAALSLSLVLAALVAAPAGAEAGGSPESYTAAATSSALDLEVFGNGLTLGHSESSVGSQPAGAARGVGALLPGAEPVTESIADAAADGASEGSPDETCGPISLPADFPVIDLATACSSALAAVASGLPTSAATGHVATAAIGVGETLASTPLGDAVDTINETLGQLLGDELPVQSTLQDLLDGLTANADLVSISLGPSSSSSDAKSDAVSTGGAAQGAVIQLVERELLGPMATIEVGAASASASITRATGVADGSFDPALVRVTVAGDVATALGLPQSVFEVAPGQTQCIPLPDPLASCITVGNGAVTETENGIEASAAGVALDLLTGLPEGGITLDLAATTASVTGVPAQVPATTTLPPVELPRTGGVPWLPLGGVGLLGAAALALGVSRLAGDERPEPKSS